MGCRWLQCLNSCSSHDINSIATCTSQSWLHRQRSNCCPGMVMMIMVVRIMIYHDDDDDDDDEEEEEEEEEDKDED